MISTLIEWMIWNVVLGGGLLTLGCLVAAMISSPVRRLQCLEWTLLVALLAPILATSSFPWKQSLHWLPPEPSVETVPLEKVTLAGKAKEQKRRETPVISTSTGSVPYISFSTETAPLVVANVHAPESKLSNTNSNTNWPVTILSVHATVVGTTVMWWGIGWFALGRLWRKGKVWRWDQLGVEYDSPMGKVEVRSHPGVNTPCAFGWWRWKILIPEHLVDAKHRKQLLMACAHEWSHLSRGDLRTWRWTRFAQLALWMQPAYWWMRSQVRLCQDYLADSEAAATSGHADFAAFLLSVARTQQTVPGTVLSLKGKKSDLTRRIRMLIESKVVLEKRCPRLLQGIALLLVCCVLSMTTLFQLDAQNGNTDQSKVVEKAANLIDKDVFTHKGSVVDEITKLPISGVKISMRMVYENGDDYTVISNEYVTNEDGKYEINIPKALWSKPSIKIRFNITHPEYVDKMGMHYWMPPEVKTGNLRLFSSKLPLHPARRISGQLVDPLGNPASNVLIKGISFKEDNTSERPYGIAGQPLEGKTDAEGHFELKAPTSGITNLSFYSKDFPALHKGVSESSKDLGVLKLQTGFRQKILLLDAVGKPAEGVNLTYQHRGEVVEEIDNVPVFGKRLGINNRMVSDEAGNVTIPLLKEGTYDFRLDSDPSFLRERPKSYAGIFLNQSALVNDDHGTIVFKAQPTVKAQVREVDTEGKPVAGDGIVVNGRYGDPDNHRQTYSAFVSGNASGFNVVEIPAGIWGNLQMPLQSKRAYDITVSDNGVTYKRGEADLGYITNDIPNILVTHRDLPVVLVHVIGETGESISDVSVTALDHLYPYQEIEFTQDTDGSWRSPSMQTYQRTQIAASKEGYYDATQYVSDLVAEEVREITLVMKKK